MHSALFNLHSFVSSPAISVSDLRKTYTEGIVFRKRQEALKGISFEVKEGA